MTPKIIITAILFVLIFITGFWVTRVGKPPQTLPLTIHKLLTVGVVVYLVFMVIGLNKSVRLGTGEFWLVLLVGLFFLTAIVTGGLTSLPKPVSMVFTRIHHLVPYPITILTALMLYLLFFRPD